jgi:hypothetical protein
MSLAQIAEFVVLTEAGELERQSLRLIASIRKFVGDAQITAVSPRPSRRPSKETIAALRKLDVSYMELDLKSPLPEYGPSYKVAALAELEKWKGAPVLVQIDSDSEFIAPADLEIVADIMARPVDLKGMCSSGDPADPFDAWWHRAAIACGADYEELPWGAAQISEDQPAPVAIRTKFDGGLVIARRDAGIFGKTAENLEKLAAAGLRPWPNRSRGYRAGSGPLSPAAARWWGSSETALMFAAQGHSTEKLPAGWNVPIWIAGAQPIVHLHYHERGAWNYHERAARRTKK